MKMDVYRIINEAKKSKLLDDDEINQLYSLANDSILLRIASQEDFKDENTDLGKLAEIIIKKRDDYHYAKKNDELEDFNKELNSEIKSKIKKDREKIKKELFDKMNNVAKDYIPANMRTGEDSPNIILFKLFLNEWNTKYAFTWKAFKNVKKEYEKTHNLEGEDLFVLKSLLEKDPNIVHRKGVDSKNADLSSGKISKLISGKITDSVVFSKANNTLTKDTIESIKEKIAKAE